VQEDDHGAERTVPSTDTLVVQSSPSSVPSWVARCMASVRAWAPAYEHIDDSFLSLAPGWVHDAARSSGSVLPVTDVARLVLLQQRLAEGWSRVVWLDADVVVFDGAVVDVEADADVSVCVERWVTGAPGGGLQAVALVNNAALSVRAVDALLEATLARARAGELHARSLGPDLLTPVHRRTPYAEIRGVSVASPHVVRGEPGAWELLVSSLPWPVGALNLCWSMASDDRVVERFIDGLARHGGGPG
jgi:hypothetical protein